MSETAAALPADLAREFIQSVRDRSPVSGWTHNFYRYPARFSPRFARAAIECFSRPGDLVLDPYMGGGTTVVEALALGRRVVGNDLNSLAVFVAKAKTTFLTRDEVDAVRAWADQVVPNLSYWASRDYLSRYLDDAKTKNLSLARARFIKKAVAGALAAIEGLPTEHARALARCALLRVGQWALDGREAQTSVSEFRTMLTAITHEMTDALEAFRSFTTMRSGSVCAISKADAAQIESLPFAQAGERASLVVTSPPYPGVHVLYHRWQVDGRRETPAPYWIASCSDGQGASFYNFGDRQQEGLHRYFESSLRTLMAIRRVMHSGALMVQLVAFSDPRSQLARYLQNMTEAGFAEVFPFSTRRDGKAKRPWRGVPGRKWHASLRGNTSSAREVVLIHRAD